MIYYSTRFKQICRHSSFLAPYCYLPPREAYGQNARFPLHRVIGHFLFLTVKMTAKKLSWDPTVNKTVPGQYWTPFCLKKLTYLVKPESKCRTCWEVHKICLKSILHPLFTQTYNCIFILVTYGILSEKVGLNAVPWFLGFASNILVERSFSFFNKFSDNPSSLLFFGSLDSYKETQQFEFKSILFNANNPRISCFTQWNYLQLKFPSLFNFPKNILIIKDYHLMTQLRNTNLKSKNGESKRELLRT